MKYVAYEASNHIFETFKTFREAEQWLLDCCNQDAHEEGYSEEMITGDCFIAEVTHITQFNIIERKEDNAEEWVYQDEFDTVGELVIVPIGDKK